MGRMQFLPRMTGAVVRRFLQMFLAVAALGTRTRGR